MAKNYDSPILDENLQNILGVPQNADRQKKFARPT